MDTWRKAGSIAESNLQESQETSFATAIAGHNSEIQQFHGKGLNHYIELFASSIFNALLFFFPRIHQCLTNKKFGVNCVLFHNTLIINSRRKIIQENTKIKIYSYLFLKYKIQIYLV